MAVFQITLSIREPFNIYIIIVITNICAEIKYGFRIGLIKLLHNVFIAIVRMFSIEVYNY